MNQSYEMKVAGLTRQLPLCKVSDDLYIGAFVIFGDVELTSASARELLKIAPEHDIMITTESKGIPLVFEMARQSGENQYLIARKAPKLYMKNPITTEVTSITTAKKQMLYIDSEDVEKMRGKRVLIIDDVIPPCRRKAGETVRRHHLGENGHPGRGRRQISRRYPVSGISPPLQSRRHSQGRASRLKKPGIALLMIAAGNLLV